jgi:hypothetical protein
VVVDDGAPATGAVRSCRFLVGVFLLLFAFPSRFRFYQLPCTHPSNVGQVQSLLSAGVDGDHLYSALRTQV